MFRYLCKSTGEELGNKSFIKTKNARAVHFKENNNFIMLRGTPFDKKYITA